MRCSGQTTPGRSGSARAFDQAAALSHRARIGLIERRLRERPGTIHHRWESEFGITVVHASERLRLVAADRAAARVLDVALGAPMLEVHRTAIALGVRAVEYRVSTVLTAQHDCVSLPSRGA